MDRSLQVLREIVERCGRGEAFAVAVILTADGSTPRKPGTRAIVEAGGAISGTVGGGALEAEVRRRAVEACSSGRPLVLDMSLGGVEAAGSEPLCGGRARVLIDPRAAGDREAWTAAARALEGRGRGLLLTTVSLAPRTEASVEWLEAGAEPDAAALRARAIPGPEALRECRDREAPRWFEEPRPEGSVGCLVEPLAPEPRLLIVGGGHIGQALAAQASPLGFDVTIVDDRLEYVDPALFPPDASTIRGDIAGEVRTFPIGADTFVVIVTRGHQHDAAALEACLRSDAAYIGMIGSRRKVALLREGLLRSGRATEAELARVRAPIGLDIGAVTVPEIATSIAAELVLVRRRGAAARGAACLRLP